MHSTGNLPGFIRLRRCWHHLRYPLTPSKIRQFVPKTVFGWIGDALCYMSDLLRVGDSWHWVMRVVKPNHRKLTIREIYLAKQVFGDAIDYSRVWVDERSLLASHPNIEAFVSFNCINYRGAISEAVFIHEMVHIWQYQRFGSIYIAQAWRAHRQDNAYDYGGLQNLWREMMKGTRFIDFSVEQQAEIVEDYYRVYVSGQKKIDFSAQAYTYFIQQLQE